MILDLESTIDEQLRSRLIENIINISIPICKIRINRWDN